MTTAGRGRAAKGVEMSDDLKEEETSVHRASRSDPRENRGATEGATTPPHPTQKVFENHKRRNETESICNRDRRSIFPDV